MERTSSTEGPYAISSELARTLLDVAVASIERGARGGHALEVTPDDYPPELREWHATFVTINRLGDLLGCIGSLEPRRPLVEDVAQNAFAAAFYDPRSPGVLPSELHEIAVHISILGRPEPMRFDSEADLVRQLRPGVDGLIIEEGFSRGTFLPSVWESVPHAEDFLLHLKLKAGLPTSYWSETLRVWRYETVSIP